MLEGVCCRLVLRAYVKLMSRWIPRPWVGAGFFEDGLDESEIWARMKCNTIVCMVWRLIQSVSKHPNIRGRAEGGICRRLAIDRSEQ